MVSEKGASLLLTDKLNSMARYGFMNFKYRASKLKRGGPLSLSNVVKAVSVHIRKCYCKDT